MSLQDLFESQKFSEVVGQHSVIPSPTPEDDLIAAGLF